MTASVTLLLKCNLNHFKTIRDFYYIQTPPVTHFFYTAVIHY